MTQFLLAHAAALQVARGYEAMAVDASDWLQESARRVFPNATTVMKVAPVEGEMDAVVDVSRKQVQEGASLQSTPLGRLLIELAAQGDFALFWASDYDDLPSVSSLEELWEILRPQLLEELGNWELYARYSHVASNSTRCTGR
jgi:hypothetical protein